MLKARKRILSLVLALLLTLSSMFMASGAFADLEETEANLELADTGYNVYGLADNVQDGQILQCWCWSFNNIKEMLPTIAAQGFTAIQTSPIQPIKESTNESWSTLMNQCWVVYQPVAFNIEDNYRNAFGTKTEFKAMCAEAEKYGIKVIVDTIFNHTANDMSGNTIHPWIPSEIRNDTNCWHDITKNIYDFDNRYDTTHYCLTGLPDLNTSNSTVQKHCINFLKECIDAGADGFRFDAVKHIETPWDASGTKSDFWPNVLNAATEYAQETKGFTPYYYGELLGTPGNGLGTDAYTEYMSVTDTGANDIRQAVCDGNASGAARSGISCGAAPSKTVQWTESHDNHKDDGTRFISDHNINKTWAIVGARDEVCGLYLARPENMDTTMIGDADVTSWSYPEVKAVNKFKNAFRGQSEYLASSGSVAYIERGTSGVVLVNTGGTYYNNVSVPAHKMASGTYEDVITGNTFTVSNGYISGDIGDTGIAVVYNADETGSLSKGSVTEFSLVGSFNSWSTSENIMVAKDSAVATTSVILQKGTYTFKIKGGDLWFGNKGTISDTTGSGGWTFNPGVDENCTLKTSAAGKYTFSFNTATQKLVVEYSEDTSSGVYVKGTFNDWDSSAQMAYSENSNIVTATLQIPKGTYSFKIHNREIGSWYSNVSRIQDSTGSGGWTMKTSVSDNCAFAATGGTYTFSFNLSTNKLVVSYDSSDAPQSTTATAAVETTPEEKDPAYYLLGEFNNWTEENPLLYTEDEDILTATLEIQEGTYGFKLYKPDTKLWYGNSATINDTTGSDEFILENGAGKCYLNASGGTYTFTLARSTKELTVDFVPFEEDTPAEPEVSQYFLRGDFNDWESVDEMTSEGNSTNVTIMLELDEGVYSFRVHNKTKAYSYGNNGNIKDTTGATSWSMHQSADDATLTATGGTYLFSFETTERRLSVTHFPVGVDPNEPVNPTLEEYTVIFVDYDDSVIDTQVVIEGAAASAPSDPVREGDEKYHYVFTGWDTPFIEVTEDLTVKAQYEQKINEYKVTFLDYNGDILSIQSIPYGEDALAPSDPVRAGDAQYSYTFKGWNGDYTSVTKDVVVTALYDENINEYSITCNSGNFEFVGESAAKYGDSYSFKINVNEGYELVYVLVGESTLTPDANGLYTIDKITGDIQINVVVIKEIPVNIFAGVSVTLESDFSLNYYIKLSEDVLADETARVEFTLPNGYIYSVYAKDLTPVNGFYVFNCPVSAKEIANNMSARLVTSTFTGDDFAYSVKSYAEAVLSSNEPEHQKAKPLLKAMLNYGAYAQKYFGHNLSVLANESLSEDEKLLNSPDLSAYKFELYGEDENVIYYGSRLSLDNKISVKHYFIIKDEENLPQFTVNGKEVTAENIGKYYEVKIDGILAHNLDAEIIVKAGNLTLDYNALSYAQLAVDGTNQKLSDVMKALCSYNTEADAFVS